MPRAHALLCFALIMAAVDNGAAADSSPAEKPRSEGLAVKAVFENLDHDYPQRIVYEREPDGSLLAWIEGERGDGMHRITFPMTPAACAGEDRES